MKHAELLREVAQRDRQIGTTQQCGYREKVAIVTGTTGHRSATAQQWLTRDAAE